MLGMERRPHTYKEQCEAIKRTITPETEMTDGKKVTDKEWFSVHLKPLLI